MQTKPPVPPLVTNPYTLLIQAVGVIRQCCVSAGSSACAPLAAIYSFVMHRSRPNYYQATLHQFLSSLNSNIPMLFFFATRTSAWKVRIFRSYLTGVAPLSSLVRPGLFGNPPNANEKQVETTNKITSKNLQEICRYLIKVHTQKPRLKMHGHPSQNVYPWCNMPSPDPENDEEAIGNFAFEKKNEEIRKLGLTITRI